MNVILKTYQSILIKFPICSQAIQTGLLMGSGDLIAQTVLEKRSLHKIDLGRTARFTFIGTFFVGPPLRIWYGFMDRHIGNKGKMATLKKVVFDQLFFAPPFLAVIMTLVDLARSSTFNEIRERLRHDYLDVLKNNYKFWPAIQLCNFYIIPLQYQVVTVQLVAIFWNTYLSWKMNQAVPMISVVPPSLTQDFK